MKKILMVQRFDVVNVGCAERIWRQAEELATRDYQVTLVQFPHSERRRTLPSLRPEAPPGVRVLALDRQAASIPENIRILSREIQSADLVHLWKCYPDTGIPVLWGLRKHPGPLHYDWDDLEGGEGGIAQRLTDSPLVGNLIGTWERLILDWADSVSVASDEIGRICQSHGFPSESIFFCPVGGSPRAIDDSILQKWEQEFGDRTVLTFLGQMEAEDFPVEVLSAIAGVMREQDDLHLVLVGDGPGRRSLEERAREEGILARCQFTGYVPHREAQAILSLSTGLLFPLKDDPMSRCKSPLVVVESLSHGTPVIASNVGEAPKMIGDCGALVSGLGEREWRNGLSTFLETIRTDSNLADRCRRQFLDNWTWGRSVDNLEKAYHHAVSRFNT